MFKSPEEVNVVTPEMVQAAGTLIGIEFTADEIELMIEGLNANLESYQSLRQKPLPNGVAPAISFDPLLGGEIPAYQDRTSDVTWEDKPSTRPDDLESLAFAPISVLANLLRTRQVTSRELTSMYMERLKRFDPFLECVVTFTEDLAFEQAARADQEIAAGNYRGPLHGIPWGAKDLLAVHGFPTTWGAVPYKEQVIDETATVVERLTEAGAVLIAKLTTGAIAYGDIWFGGKTKNPWNLEVGASGSSAGPAAAVAGGVVGFAIGSETLGSIVSPSTRCGISGLRPTFGRISRHGVMALCWSMDKLGPMARTVEDCALVFQATHGADPRDRHAISRPFSWPYGLDWKELTIGYVETAFEEERDGKSYDDETLKVFEGLGASLTPISLPDYPYSSMNLILAAETAAAFDELTRSGQDDLMVWQDKEAWPNIWRRARLIPAVEFIQANRLRRQAMLELAELFEQIDLFVCPSFGGESLRLTNFSGHPAVVLPNGLSEDGIPNNSITFTGQLFGEAPLVAVAQAYQEATGFHKTYPPMIYGSQSEAPPKE